MKIFIFQKRQESRFAGVTISDSMIEKIKGCKPKEIYERVIDNICCEPKKEFKSFVKKLKKGDFLKNYVSVDSLDFIDNDLLILANNSNFVENTIVFLYKLSLEWEQLKDPYSSLLFNDIPF